MFKWRSIYNREIAEPMEILKGMVWKPVLQKRKVQGDIAPQRCPPQSSQTGFGIQNLEFNLGPAKLPRIQVHLVLQRLAQWIHSHRHTFLWHYCATVYQCGNKGKDPSDCSNTLLQASLVVHQTKTVRWAVGSRISSRSVFASLGHDTFLQLPLAQCSQPLREQFSSIGCILEIHATGICW